MTKITSMKVNAYEQRMNNEDIRNLQCYYQFERIALGGIVGSILGSFSGFAVLGPSGVRTGLVCGAVVGVVLSNRIWKWLNQA